MIAIRFGALDDYPENWLIDWLIDKLPNLPQIGYHIEVKIVEQPQVQLVQLCANAR